MTLNGSLLYEEEEGEGGGGGGGGGGGREDKRGAGECCSRGDSRTLGSGRKHVNKATLKCIGSEMSWLGKPRRERRASKNGGGGTERERRTRAKSEENEKRESPEWSYPSADRKKEKYAPAWRSRSPSPLHPSLSLSLSLRVLTSSPVRRKKEAVVPTRFSTIKPDWRRGSFARTRARAEPVSPPSLSLSLRASTA